MNVDLKNLRIVVAPISGLDQSSSVDEILAHEGIKMFTVYDFCQANNNEEFGDLNGFWTFIIDIVEKVEYTGSNTDGVDMNVVSPETVEHLDEPIHFISSNGDLYVNSDGTINPQSDIDDWLLTISKVDMEELKHYYELNCFEDPLDCGDVLEFGYWDKESNYHAPDNKWRKDVFHNINLSDDRIDRIIEIAANWVTVNR